MVEFHHINVRSWVKVRGRGKFGNGCIKVRGRISVRVMVRVTGGLVLGGWIGLGLAGGGG